MHECWLHSIIGTFNDWFHVRTDFPWSYVKVKCHQVKNAIICPGTHILLPLFQYCLLLFSQVSAFCRQSKHSRLRAITDFERKISVGRTLCVCVWGWVCVCGVVWCYRIWPLISPIKILLLSSCFCWEKLLLSLSQRPCTDFHALAFRAWIHPTHCILTKKFSNCDWIWMNDQLCATWFFYIHF